MERYLVLKFSNDMGPLRAIYINVYGSGPTTAFALSGVVDVDSFAVCGVTKFIVVYFHKHLKQRMT